MSLIERVFRQPHADLVGESRDAQERAQAAEFHAYGAPMFGSPRLRELDGIEAPSLDPVVFSTFTPSRETSGAGSWGCERCDVRWSMRAGIRCRCCGRVPR